MALNAETQAILASAGRIDGISGDIKAVVARLRNEVAESASYWQGRGATGFGNTMAGWDGAANRLNTVLDEISERLRASGHTYDQTESDNAHLAAIDVPPLNVTI